MNLNITTVTKDYCPGLFFGIKEFITEHSMMTPRRGSNFHTKSIIVLKPEDEKWFIEKVKNFQDFVGIWETNKYVLDPEMGEGYDEIDTLTRVSKITVMEPVDKWVPIKPC